MLQAQSSEEENDHNLLTSYPFGIWAKQNWNNQ